MYVVVGDDDGVFGTELLFRDKPGDDFRGKKMSGYAQVGLNAFEKPDHGLRVQAIEREAAARMLPGLVGAFVDDTH